MGTDPKEALTGHKRLCSLRTRVCLHLFALGAEPPPDFRLQEVVVNAQKQRNNRHQGRIVCALVEFSSPFFSPTIGSHQAHGLDLYLFEVAQALGDLLLGPG